jgi:BolA family transcriptional regulator, general stress-responsive regulator
MAQYYRISLIGCKQLNVLILSTPVADPKRNDLAEGGPELDEHSESRIKAILFAALAPVSVDVIDESHRHASHTHTLTGTRTGAGTTSNGTHLRIRIVSEAFRGKSRVERHRAINCLLRAEFEGGLHALAIDARAPGE